MLLGEVKGTDIRSLGHRISIMNNKELKFHGELMLADSVH